MGFEHEGKRDESKRPPLWLRILLMILLVLFASFGFYMVNLNIIEKMNQQ